MPRKSSSDASRASKVVPERPKSIFLDVGQPEQFKETLIKGVCLNPDGKLRTLEEMKTASSFLIDVAATIDSISSLGPMASFLLELGKSLK